jgi:hypothetical protein
MPVKRLVGGLAAVLTAITVLTGCSEVVTGKAGMGSRNIDSASFFAGDVDVYGQTVSANDKTELAYLRAMRRIDVCGLVTRNALANVGEPGSVGTLFAFNECDLDLKVPGETARKFISVEVKLSRPGSAVAFRVGDTPIYQSGRSSCQYLVPLDLSRLPGAHPMHKPEQPFIQVGGIAQEDCGVAMRVAQAVAQSVATAPLPPRDAVAAYPAALAERDPCQVLAVVAADVDHWDIAASQPHKCDFSIWRTGFRDVLPMQVNLQPEPVDFATQGRDRRERDGVEVYFDRKFCTAVSFVGAPMQRRVIGAGYVNPGDLVIRPAVVVDASGGGANCEAVADVATEAAKLYS